MDAKSIKCEAEIHRKYAAKYNCTLLEAIADRDWPLTSNEISDILTELGILPTAANVAACRPHSDAALAAHRAELAAERAELESYFRPYEPDSYQEVMEDLIYSEDC